MTRKPGLYLDQERLESPLIRFYPGRAVQNWIEKANQAWDSTLICNCCNFQ